MKKFLQTVVLFQFVLVALLVNMLILSSRRQNSLSSLPESLQPERSITSEKGSGRVLGFTIESADARALLLTQFIKRYQPDSPFLAHTDYFIKTADLYGLDFRLIPAIAMCESNLGVKLPKRDSFNAWGIAVYTDDIKGKKFTDWKHAIDWVGRYIRDKYLSRNITELVDIEAIWAPPSVNDNHSWATCVERFMDQID